MSSTILHTGIYPSTLWIYRYRYSGTSTTRCILLCCIFSKWPLQVYYNNTIKNIYYVYKYILDLTLNFPGQNPVSHFLPFLVLSLRAQSVELLLAPSSFTRSILDTAAPSSSSSSTFTCSARPAGPSTAKCFQVCPFPPEKTHFAYYTHCSQVFIQTKVCHPSSHDLSLPLYQF